MNMTDKILEQLSALADGELPRAEASLLLLRMAREPALKKAWERYHLAGEAMRGSLADVHDRNFADKVMTAIGDVEAPAGRRLAAGRWLVRLRPVAGMAVAASVALAAIVSLQPMPGTAPPSEIVPQNMAAGASGVPLLRTQQVDFSGVQSPELQNQLRSYLMNHNEHAGSASLRGVMPYVHIAAYDKRPVDDSAPVEEETSEKPEAGRR